MRNCTLTDNIASNRQVTRGLKNPDDMATVYSAGDVMLVPSRIESFGQTASEALACGTPVVCFDTSGLRDIVRNAVCGNRVSSRSAKNLAMATEQLMEQKNIPELVAKEAELFDLRFTVSQQRQLYNRLYDENQTI